MWMKQINLMKKRKREREGKKERRSDARGGDIGWEGEGGEKKAVLN